MPSTTREVARKSRLDAEAAEANADLESHALMEVGDEAPDHVRPFVREVADAAPPRKGHGHHQGDVSLL